jgi:hypothetical protein
VRQTRGAGESIEVSSDLFTNPITEVSHQLKRSKQRALPHPAKIPGSMVECQVGLPGRRAYEGRNSFTLALLAVPRYPAEAGRLDCSLFRGAQSQFACYENLSRAPKLDLDQPAKPGAAKSALTRTRSTGANGITPAARRWP